MKIKSIKEIVNGDSNKELVHVIGTVVTKKEFDWGSKRKRDSKRLFFLLKSGNYCINAELDEGSVENYKCLVKRVRIDKPIYVESTIDEGRLGDTYKLFVSNVSTNIILKRLEHEEKTLEIEFLMALHSANEAKAIEFVNSHKELDVNYEYWDRLPIFSAVDYGMSDLFTAILEHPKFKANVEDGFGETLLESLMYLYTADDNSDEDRAQTKKYIDTILKSNKIDFNQKDLNEDVAINIACQYPKLFWVAETLIPRENVDVNIINDFDYSPLTSAIDNNNIKAIELLSKRKDIVVREIDVEKAKENNIDLSKYGLEIKAESEFACAMAE
jgi:hypothetical protein